MDCSSFPDSYRQAIAGVKFVRNILNWQKLWSFHIQLITRWLYNEHTKAGLAKTSLQIFYEILNKLVSYSQWHRAQSKLQSQPQKNAQDGHKQAESHIGFQAVLGLNALFKTRIV